MTDTFNVYCDESCHLEAASDNHRKKSNRKECR